MAAVADGQRPAPPTGPTPGAAAATLPARLLAHAAERPRAVALRHKRLGLWAETTWAAFAERAALTGLGLAELGVVAGDRVAIHAENRPEWLYADLGVQGLGAVAVGVYPTSPEAEVEYLLAHSGAVVLIAEDEEQADKALAVRARGGAPELRTIVVVDPRGLRGLDGETLITFDDLLERGRRRHVEEWAASVAALAPADVAVVVYTSGTTGPPKGAMLTHANLVAAGATASAFFALGPRDEILSYLPLCHVAERLVTELIGLSAGYVVNFGEGPDTFTTDLREVQPTFLLGVPRVWEKMMAGVETRMRDASLVKRRAYAAALRTGRRVSRRRLDGRARALDRVAAGAAGLAVLGALRAKLGLSRCRVALSGAAPVAPEVLAFFWALGVPVREAYGQTENTALATATPADDVRLGTVGVPLPGVEVTIAADGEVLTRSAGVFAGYYRDPDATRAALTADGFLRTGDVGAFDDDGHLRLTGRQKDIIITAGGKNVSPAEIENRLKTSPWIREAIVVGDRRPYLVALVGIEFDTVGDWAARRGIGYTTYADLAARPEVSELVDAVVAQANEAVARVAQIKRVWLLDAELDQDDGQLTATQKVKRQAIAAQFADRIDGLYA